MNTSEKLLEFIKSTPTAFHCAENVKKILSENGFSEFPFSLSGELKPGNKYYIPVGDSAVIAFRLPESDPDGLFIVAAHGDSPSFRLKTTGEEFKAYNRLLTEKYGGMILSTWLDRPLGIAGRVSFQKDGKVVSKNVILPGNAIIPNTPIHFNRKLNDGYVYNPATDMLPLYSGTEGTLKKRIASSAGCDTGDILDFDLFLYNAEDGIVWGEDGEYISAPRLDDLQCVFSCLEGFISAEKSDGVQMLAVFDNEEVGSRSICGADCLILTEIARKIADTYGTSLLALTENGRLFSADNAHAAHPNHPELSDGCDRPVLGKGIVIKYNPSRSYITSGKTSAELRLKCEEAGIKYQMFSNRPDTAGGSTLGNIAATQLPIEGVDVGIAQLAMHSAYETAGAKDTDEMIKAVKAFLK